MAISFVSNALGGTTTTTTFSITLPTTAAGDIIILEYTNRATAAATIGGTYSGPAFTSKHAQNYATNTFHGRTLWSRATGNHSGQTVTGSGLTDSCAAIVTIYRGCIATGDPLAGATIVGEDNASGNETQAQITTTRVDTWVVLVVSNTPDLSVSSLACTSPGTLTKRAEVLSTGGTDASITHASELKATAGATGAFTWAMAPNAICGSWAYAILSEQPKDLVANAPGGSLSITGSANLQGKITLNAWVFPGTSGARGYFSDLGAFRTEVGMPWTLATFFRVDTTSPAHDGVLLQLRHTGNDAPNHRLLFEETNDKLSYAYGYGTEADTGPVAATTWYLGALTHSGAVSAPVVLRLISAAGAQIEQVNGIDVFSDFFDGLTQQISYGSAFIGGVTSEEFLGRMCLPLFVRGTALTQAQLEAYAADPLNYGDQLLFGLGSHIAAWFDNTSLDRGPGAETLTLTGGVTLGSANGPSVLPRSPGAMIANLGTLSITGTAASLVGPSTAAVDAFVSDGTAGNYANFSDFGHLRTNLSNGGWTVVFFVRPDTISQGDDKMLLSGIRVSNDQFNHELVYLDGVDGVRYDYSFVSPSATVGAPLSTAVWIGVALTHSGTGLGVTLRLISAAGSQIASTTGTSESNTDDAATQEVSLLGGHQPLAGSTFNPFIGRASLPLIIRGYEATQSELEQYIADPLNKGDAFVATHDGVSGKSVVFIDDSHTDQGAGAETLTLHGTMAWGTANGPVVPQRASVAEDITANGSLSITGTAANLKALGTLLGNTGSLSISGNLPNLRATGTLLANAPGGTLSITGNLPNLRATGTVLANAPGGSLSITGFANLKAPGTLLANVAGSLSITGSAAALKASGTLLANVAGTLSISGAANLTELGTSVLTATTGALAITGAGTLTGAATLTATAGGALAISGSANLTELGTSALTATTGSLALTGSATLVDGGPVIVNMTADGSLSITGDADDFNATAALTATTGSLSITGQPGLASNIKIVGARLSTFGPFLPFRRSTASQQTGGLSFGLLGADGTLSISGDADDFSATGALAASSGALAITGDAGLSSVAVLRIGALPSRFGPFLGFRRGTGSSVLVASSALAADGTLTITGTVAALAAPAQLVANTGALSITGSAAPLLGSGVLVAPGTLSITGSSADLRLIGVLVAPGTLSITGSAATLFAHGSLYAAGQLSLTGGANLTDASGSALTALQGELSITGSAALRALAALAANTGSLAITGGAQLMGAGGLGAATGSLAITGTAASLVAGSTSALAANTGSLAITGTAADLDARGVLAALGTLSITGSSAALIAGSTSALTAQQGALAITGAANVSARGTLQAAVGSLAITGTASLIAGSTSALTAQQGTVSITGAADLRASGALAATGSLAITATAAPLSARGTLTATTGAGVLAIGGAAVLINAGSSALTAQLGSLAITGSGATPSARGALASDGSLALTGSAGVTATGALAATTGALALTGGAQLTGAGTLATAGGDGAVAISGTDAQLRAIAVLRSNGTVVLSGAAQLRAVGSLLATGTLSINGIPSMGTGGARYRAVVVARVRERSARIARAERVARVGNRIRDVRAKEGRNTT